MSRTVFPCRISQLIDHTANVRELILDVERPEGLEFKAGQFVMLHVPQDPKPALRAYSLASGEQDKKQFKLLFKYVEKGVASEFVWKLKGDETLNFTGPFGKMFFKEPPTEQIIFLNTGTGISQHMSYLLSKGQQYKDVNYKMLFGVRTQQDIYYQKQLDQLKTTISNFDYQFVLSRSESDWQGLKGYVQDHIQQYEYLQKPTTFYLCGNGAMIKQVKARLEQEGFDKTRVFAEAFD